LTNKIWDDVASREAPSWYLDPLVARQKREANLELIRRWSAGQSAGSILKTDLFEEAFGEDQFLEGLFPAARRICGLDHTPATVLAAAARFPRLAPGLAVMDVIHCGFRSEAFDLVISNSTLDHFPSRAQFLAALKELARVLSPGGLLIIALDNPLNPLYHPLKWLSRLKSAPFPLGYTPAPATLRADLGALGFVLEGEDWLLHNPRGLSTALFLVLRKLMGRRADQWIARLLSAFAMLGALPARRFTACFFCVAARRR